MTFGQPLWFWAFALVPLLIVTFLLNERKRALLVQRFVSARLAPQLAGNVSIFRRRLRFIALLLGLSAILLSLAQPRWGYTWEDRKFKGRDVLIAIDVSRSMLANDLSPSRLARAKLAAQDLIELLPGDRVGLIAFAGTTFLQAPLTADHGAVLDSLRELDTDIIPRGGTNISEAIRAATDAFGKGESDNRALVLFTDGEDLEEDAVAAAKDVSGSIRIFTVGLGSAEGTVIALPGKDGQTEYVKDPDGQIVKSQLDEPRLQEIAQAANGFYVHLLSGPAEMQQIVRDGLKPMAQHDLDSQFSRRPIERYQWPLAAGMILLAASMLIGERKRQSRLQPMAAAAAVLLFASFSPSSASAKNDGVTAYEQKDYKGAVDSFDKQLQKKPSSDVLQFDLGSAAYKTGDFDRALQNFSNAVTSQDQSVREKAEYNIGNTLFQRGVGLKEKPAQIQELKNALQHYDAALKVQPGDADAKYNRDVAQKFLEALQQEQKQQQQQQQDKDQQKKDQDQQKQDQQKNQQSKDQQSKDQKGQNQQSQQQQQQQQQGQGQSKDQQQQQQSSGNGQQQQPQNGGQKDQQTGQQGDQKDAQSQQQQQGQQQQKDQKTGEQKDSGQKGEQQQQQQGKGEEAKNEPKQDSTGDHGNQQQQQQEQQQESRKLTGELKDAGKPKEGDQAQQAEQAKQTPEQEAAEEAAAAAEGRMTEQQARNLLESLKGEDDRVRLLNPKDSKGAHNNPRSFRDW